MFWDKIHTIIDGAHWGFPRGDGVTLPWVDKVNIAGFVYQLVCGFPVNFQTTFQRVYAEGLFKIGDFGASPGVPNGGSTYWTRSGIVIRDSHFDFQTQGPGWPMPDFFVQGAGVEYEGTTLRIYNGDPATGRGSSKRLLRACVFCGNNLSCG